MRYDYYLHKSGGYAFDYFGGIGRPYKVSFLRACIAKVLKYHVTTYPKGRPVSQKSLYTRAALHRDISRKCYFMKQLREGRVDSV